MDVGSHAVHLAEWLIGPVRSVQALVGTQVHDYEVDDGATLLLEAGDDVHVVVRAAFNARPGRSRLRIAGTLGDLVASGTVGQLPDGTVHVELLDPESPSAAPVKQELEYETVNTYLAMAEAFCRALRSGRPAPVNDIDESVSVMRVLDAAYRSGKQGRRIEIPDRP